MAEVERKNVRAPQKDIVGERKMLPEGNVAIVSGKSFEGAPGSFCFTLQIGSISRFNTRSELQAARGRAEERMKGFNVSRGEHAGWIGIKPIGGSAQFVELEVPRFEGQVRGNVQLVLMDPAREETVRTAEIPASVFVQEGFDLDGKNISNHGLILNPVLSQLLYDFQENQGQFSPSAAPKNQ